MSAPPGAGLRVAVTVEQCWQPVPGGSGTYIVELLRALTDPGRSGGPAVAARGLAAAHRRPAPQDVRPPVPVDHAPLPRRALYDAWNHLGLPRAEHLVRGSVDVVHATTWAVPPTRLPLVVTVHDLAFVRDPAHFTPRGVRFFDRALERTRAEADLVVVPSQATAADCAAAGLDRDRVVVVPHGVRVTTPAPDEVAQFRRRRGLTAPYVLWTGTREPRKNLPVLLEAYAHLAAQHPGVELALVGPQGWGEAAGEEDRPGPGTVRFLGRLSWPELQLAYAGASAFCYPSLWEGFGLPVLEAMAHGVPVVTSAGTSMAEVVGDAGVLVDPADPEAVARGLRRALDDAAALADAGRRRAAGFTWAAAAEATAAVYARAAGR